MEYICGLAGQADFFCGYPYSSMGKRLLFSPSVIIRFSLGLRKTMKIIREDSQE
jgi:hypothetical protein